MSTMRDVLRSLVTDIEAMQDHGEAEQFGPFYSTLLEDPEDGRVYIEWPNLAIMLDKAKAVLAADREADIAKIRSAPNWGYLFDRLNSFHDGMAWNAVVFVKAGGGMGGYSIQSRGQDIKQVRSFSEAKEFIASHYERQEP